MNGLVADVGCFIMNRWLKSALCLALFLVVVAADASCNVVAVFGLPGPVREDPAVAGLQ